MKSLGERLGVNKQNLDKKCLENIDAVLAAGIVAGTARDILLDMKARYENAGVDGYFTDSQRKLIRKIEREYEDYPLWLEARNKLAELYNMDKLPPHSLTFVADVIASFDEYHKWTPLQYEQIATLLQAAEAKEKIEAGDGDAQ